MTSMLIVDDEEDVRDIYNEFIQEKLGYKDLTFSNDGIDAFMKCSMQKFDVILLDHRMPRLNGLDLLVAIRNQPGLNQFTPVIIISGTLAETFTAKNLFQHTYFLTKPIDYDQLEAYLLLSGKESV